MVNNSIKIYFFVIIILVCSCCGGKGEVKQITYNFSADTEDVYNVFIAYKDSSGYNTLYTDTIWTKDVYLGPGDVASLLIIPQTEADIYYTGKIICNDNIRTSGSKNVISLSVLTNSL